MSEETPPRNGETEPSETGPPPERDERKWSDWERQKVEVYSREHPDEESEPASGEAAE
jgi:hypothetical protein